MLVHPGMVGRALQRVVERDFEAVRLRPVDERVEVVDGAELGRNGEMAAVLAADRPRAAGIVRGGADRVVATLAERLTDRVDGRQVHDVEAHRRDVGQPLRRRVETTFASREHLVPRTFASHGDDRPTAVTTWCG